MRKTTHCAGEAEMAEGPHALRAAALTKLRAKAVARALPTPEALHFEAERRIAMYRRGEKHLARRLEERMLER